MTQTFCEAKSHTVMSLEKLVGEVLSEKGEH